MLDTSLDVIDDPSHSLLDPPTPRYTNATVRRAFIVWLYCGQRNQFRDVCNYYHHLEAMEENLSPVNRASSRHLEFNLFTTQPPVSPYLLSHFPLLYSQAHIQNYYLKKLQSLRQETMNHGIKESKGATQNEILEASSMIEKYCKKRQIPVKEFLSGFKEYATKCNLKDTVGNVGFYIKRRTLHAELVKNGFKFETTQVNSITENKVDNRSNVLENQERLLTGVTKTTDKKKRIDSSVDYHVGKDGLTDKDFETNLKTSGNLEGCSAIKILKRDSVDETNLKLNASFLNFHLLKVSEQKCRKI